MKEHILVSKNIYKLIENAVHGVDTNSLVKINFQVQWSVKKVMLTVFLDMKGFPTIDLLENGVAINHASYCHLPRKNSPYLLNDPCVCVCVYIYIYI